MPERNPVARVLGGLRRLASTAMLSVIAYFAPTGAPIAGALDNATLDLSNYALTFDDSFKSLDISARGPNTRWTAHTPWGGDFGEAIFSDPGPQGPFELTAKGLDIVAKKGPDGRWRSGLISSRDVDGPEGHGFAQQFGYFELRARLPDGPGVWPAFWLIGVDKTKFAAEIDVLEFYGQFPGYFHNWAHVFRDKVDVLLQDHLVSVPSGSLSSGYNDFGVLIESDVTRFYLNRVLVWSLPTPPEYHQPMYILANLALGGGWPIDRTKSPSRMSIQHIQVYQKKT